MSHIHALGLYVVSNKSPSLMCSGVNETTTPSGGERH